MVVEELHAGVLVLPLLEVDARLLQFLRTQTFLRLVVTARAASAWPLRRIVGIAVVGRVQFRQHLALAHRLSLFNINFATRPAIWNALCAVTLASTDPLAATETGC